VLKILRIGLKKIKMILNRFLSFNKSSEIIIDINGVTWNTFFHVRWIPFTILYEMNYFK